MKNIKNMGYLLLVVFGLIVFGLFIFSEYLPMKGKLKRIEERQANRNKLELSHAGGGALYTPPDWKEKYFNYTLRSWDGGKTWYAIEYDRECEGGWGIRILGEVDTLYPGLLKHIEGMDAFSKYIDEKGTIDGTDPEGLKILENAGFILKIDSIVN